MTGVKPIASEIARTRSSMSDASLIVSMTFLTLTATAHLHKADA